jgi:DNA mismatch repair protein MutL
VIIDQHAAHERILYEKAKKSFQSRTAASQQLLFPHTVEFSAEDFDNLMEILPYLQKLGFVVKGFGTRTVVVEGVPSGLHIGNEERLLLDILDEYKLNRGSEADIQERLAKSYACRSAIKTGHRLTAEMMNSLIAELFTIENPYFCPHGRPVIITIPIDDLDKRFERK